MVQENYFLHQVSTEFIPFFPKKLINGSIYKMLVGKSFISICIQWAEWSSSNRLHQNDK